MGKGSVFVTVALRGAKIAHAKDKGKNKSNEQEPPRFKEELEALSVSISGHDDIKKASQTITCVVTNVVQRIELVSFPLPEYAKPDDRVSVCARLHT